MWKITLLVHVKRHLPLHPNRSSSVSWTWLQQTFGDAKHQMDWSQWDSRQEQRSFSFKLLKITGSSYRNYSSEDGMQGSFGGYCSTWINILKALCPVPILNNVPTSALKSCKLIFSPARPCAKHLLLQTNAKTGAVSPAEKKLVSAVSEHLKYNAGDFGNYKICIRYTVCQFPVCETTLIINHGFKCILKILAKMFHKCKVLADYQGEFIQERIIQW